MPSVKKNESQQDYVSRCIPIVINEGTAKDSSQAAAICHSMYRTHHRKDKVLSLSAADSDTVAVTGQPLEFWKELIPVGPFHKNGNKTIVDEEDLNYWRDTGKTMLSDGIMIPVPVEHTKDPEKRRGDTVDFDVRPNKKGVKSLYGRIKFHDEASAKALSHSGVSIYVPTAVYNKDNKPYITPIQHIAITDYPVLNGLEPFQPIQLSYGDNTGGSASLRSIADMLGIPPTVTDTQELIDAIAEAVAAEENPAEDAGEDTEEQAAGPGVPPAGAGTPPAGNAGVAPGNTGMMPADGTQTVHVNTPVPHTIVGHIVRPANQAASPPTGLPPSGQPAGKPAPKPGGTPPFKRKPAVATSKTPTAALSQNILTTLKSARKVKIDQLVQHHKITPAVAKRLEARYLTDDALQLSNDEDDGFNDVVADHEANERIIGTKGKTSVQGNALALSADDELDPENNALLRDADKRCKVASNLVGRN